MNILLVSRDFLFGGGAAARWSSFADYLSRRHSMFVVTSTSGKLAEQHPMNKTITILPAPLKPKITTIPFMSPVNIFLLAFYLTRLLAKISIDVVIVTVPEFEEGIASAIACKICKKRLIVDVRDVIAEDHVQFVYWRFPRAIQRIVHRLLSTSLIWLFNSSNVVVTVTSTLKKLLQSDGVRVPVHLVTNGADTTLFHPVSPDKKLVLKKEVGLENNSVILYAGALDVEYYPLDVILLAFRIVAKAIPNAKLILCGAGNEEKFQRMGNDVHYLGLLKQEEVAKVMQASDVGLISMDERKSTFCALTTKFFEYLGSGLPVVAACPRGGELDMLISSRQVGFGVGSKDYESMADRIITLLSCDSERQILARNGIELVSLEFNRRKLAETYGKILSHIEKSAG